MKQTNCKNCVYYSAYYKKLSLNFERLTNGFCEKHQQLQVQYETCDAFISNEKREEYKERRLQRQLEQSLDSINIIAQILKDNNEQEG